MVTIAGTSFITFSFSLLRNTNNQVDLILLESIILVLDTNLFLIVFIFI